MLYLHKHLLGLNGEILPISIGFSCFNNYSLTNKFNQKDISRVQNQQNFEMKKYEEKYFSSNYTELIKHNQIDKCTQKCKRNMDNMP